MRRTIEFGCWMAATWEVRASARTRGVEEPLREGLAAYAAEHVQREKTTCTRLTKKWAGIRGKGRAYLAREPLGEGETVLVHVGGDDDGTEGAGAGPDEDDDEDDEGAEGEGENNNDDEGDDDD